MELQFPSIPLLLCFLLFVFMVFEIAKKTRSKTSSPKLPPGPWKLPLIGNMHQLAVSGSLPHHTLREMAGKYGPLMLLKLGEVATIIITSPEIAKEVLKTHDINFAQRPFVLTAKILSYNSTNIVSSPYGGYWRQMRKICVEELLSSKRVQTFQGIREEEVSDFIRSISQERELPINLSKKISSLTCGIVCRMVFGKKCKYQELLISIVEDATTLVAGFTIVDMYPSVKLLEVVTGLRRKLEKMSDKMDNILGSIIREHKERKKAESGNGEVEGEDLVDVLLRIQKQGDLECPLTDDNIKAVLLDIISAGFETSSRIVEWAMTELLKNPQLLKRAQDEVRDVFDKKGNVDESGLHELKYLNSIIKETLRLHPTAPLVVRESSEKCIVSGYDIPAKTKVIVNAWAMGRDPTYWTEPEKFNPERFIDSETDYKGRNFEYIPFGAGRRMCPGMSFALPNMEFPLAQLLYHFDWKLPNGMKPEELDMEEKFGIAVRRMHHLYLIPIPYDHPSPAK